MLRQVVSFQYILEVYLELFILGLFLKRETLDVYEHIQEALIEAVAQPLQPSLALKPHNFGHLHVPGALVTQEYLPVHPRQRALEQVEQHVGEALQVVAASVFDTVVHVHTAVAERASEALVPSP